MKIPKHLNVHTCIKCREALQDSAYKRCGVGLVKAQFFFDYECGSCGHLGRYVLDIKDRFSPSEALIALADMLEETKGKQGASKGNIASELNKIVGVQDLLKQAGGNDAPREPSKDKPK